MAGLLISQLKFFYFTFVIIEGFTDFDCQDCSPNKKKSILSSRDNTQEQRHPFIENTLDIFGILGHHTNSNKNTKLNSPGNKKVSSTKEYRLKR